MDIHCKVLYGEEFRRFVVKSASFKELFETVKRLFNLPDGCTLKYKDDEGDLVTMSSDEELLSAVEFTTKLLHIVVANPSQPQETQSICPKFGNFGNFQKFGGPHHHQMSGGHGGHPGHQFGPHGHHGHHGHHGPPGHMWGGRKGCKREKWGKHEKRWENKNCPRRNPEFLQKRIVWFTKKRDDFQRRADEIQAILVKEGLLPPDLLHEQQIIERKLAGITNRLEKLSIFSSQLESSKEQVADPESLPDFATPAQPLTDEERERYSAELKELRENLFKTCFFSTKEAKMKMKFCRSQLNNFGGNPESEEGKRQIQEWENARNSLKENKEVLKSVLKREKELCGLLGVEVFCKRMMKKEKCHEKKHCSKKFKHK